MGLAVTPIAVAGTAGVARAEAGLASGLLNTSRTVGAAIGLAALATVAANRTTRALAGTATTAGHTAAALTDGYALAFSVAAALLVVDRCRGSGHPSRTQHPPAIRCRRAGGAAEPEHLELEQA